MKTYTYYLLIAMLALAACENELPFDIKDNPPKLVMNALINADSLTNVLYLNLTGKESTTHIRNSTLEVRINGELRESLRPLPVGEDKNPQCRFNITGKFTPGDIVRIDALTDDGQHHAWVEITVPQRPGEIENIDTLTVPLTNYNYTEDYLRYKITFKDRPNETNYYRIVVDKQTILKRYDLEKGEGYIYWVKHNYNFIGREDIVLTDGQPTNEDDENNGVFDTVENIYGVFDDSRFQNTSYTMTIYNRTHIETTDEPGFFEGINIIIRLLSITETEYYYLKALNFADSYTYDETMNDPIKYPGNVHGGTGIVGISTEVNKIIHINNPQR